MAKKLEDTFTLKINDEDREILMSYALLDEVCSIFDGNIEMIMAGPMSTDIRNNLVHALLREYDEKGKPKEDVNLRTLKVSNQDMFDLLSWAQGHALDFFIQTMTKAANMAKGHEKSLTSLGSLTFGNGTSTLPTQSAG